LKVSIETAQREGNQTKGTNLKGEHELHLRKADAARAALPAEQHTSDAHEALTFDLQKVMSLPDLTTNEVYYCHQLSTYNLGVHSLTTDKVIMHVWDVI